MLRSLRVFSAPLRPRPGAGLALALVVALLTWPASVPAQTANATPDARLGALRTLIQDDSPHVRAQALRSLAKLRTAEAAALALTVLDRPMDANLDYALWLTINDLAEPWMTALQSGAWKAEGKEKQLEFALRALKPEQVTRVLGSVLGDQPLPRDGSGPWIEIIGRAGNPDHLKRLVTQAEKDGFDEAATARALQSLGEAARLRKLRPAGNLPDLSPFLRRPAGTARTEAIRLAGLWREIGPALPVLLDSLAAQAATPTADRALAFESLRQIGSPEVVRGLKKLVTPEQDAAVRRTAAVTLAALDATAGFRAVIEASSTLKTDAEALAYWREAVAIKGSALPLREALADRQLSELAAKAAMRAAREGGKEDIELVTALAKAGGLATDTEKLTGELLKELATKAAASGDAHRGELIFRRPELACTTCHAIGGAGGLVGPDLTSIGASAPLDYLVESLLLPNSKIKEGYHSVIVETKDGQEVTGTLARETQQELFLRNVAGKEVAIAKSNIARRENGKLSLMPSGLLEPLPENERLDLFAFLGQLGKPGEFDASKGGVARFWHLANVVHTDLQNNDGDWFWKRGLDDKRWIAAYTLVSGGLPRGVLEDITKAQAWTSKVAMIAATEVQQATAGPVRFRTGSPDAEVWVEGRLLGKGAEVSGDLPAGRQRVVLKFDPRRLPDVLRLDATGTAFVLN